jgi:hypothetical protein
MHQIILNWQFEKSPPFTMHQIILHWQYKKLTPFTMHQITLCIGEATVVPRSSILVPEYRAANIILTPSSISTPKPHLFLLAANPPPLA